MLSLKVNSHCMRRDESRCIAMRRIMPCAFLSVYAGEALPDNVSYNSVTKTHDMLLSLA